jgi:hypothetical protein
MGLCATAHFFWQGDWAVRKELLDLLQQGPELVLWVNYRYWAGLACCLAVAGVQEALLSHTFCQVVTMGVFAGTNVAACCCLCKAGSVERCKAAAWSVVLLLLHVAGRPRPSCGLWAATDIAQDRRQLSLSGALPELLLLSVRSCCHCWKLC